MPDPPRSIGKKQPIVRRSKDGCLTCRKKRKKCDETWPVCLRCDRTRSSCVWPPWPTFALGTDSIDNQASLDIGINGLGADYLASCLDTDNFMPLPNYAPLPHSTSSGLTCSSWRWEGPSGVPTFPSFHATPNPRMTKSLAARMWEYAHDLGPRIVWPPEGCINSDELDPEGIMPAFRQSITALTRTTPIEPIFHDIFYFYSTFLTRVFYDYALPPDTILNWISRKFHSSSSAKYGMLCMAGLYLADYERSTLARSWREGLQEVYSIAIGHLSQDLEDTRLSPWEKLAGLTPIMDYEFHTGQISKYFSHVTKALPLVKAVLGSDTIDLLNLGGEQMFDVNMWAWCDILDSMATCTPTRLKYVSDLERVQESADKGIEWIYGIPNVLAVLLARTSALRHAQLSEQETVSKGTELERMIRNWQIRPLGTRDSRLRVARVGAQEIWRHTAILYLHQVIFKSSSDHPMVRDSVKNIVKIASTLEPGGNPDSFLYLPYFISAFYAISPKDRYIMRSRLVNCGNALYLRNMARYLDELWKETGSVGHFTSWSEKKPPRVAF